MGQKASDFNELLKGASINQLAQLFDLDRRTVADRLKDITPSGKRNTFAVYRISEVAELLVTGYMTKDKLNETQKRKYATSEKDYWDAQLKRLKYLENTGDLWRTEKVVEVFAEVFKQFREAVVVFADEMEHESGLTDDQITKTKAFCDELLTEMRDRLLGLDIPAEGDHDDVDGSLLPDDEKPDSADTEGEDDLASLGLG